MLHIHALLWLTNAPDFNVLVQQLKNNKAFKRGLLDYLDDIIVQILISQKPIDYNETNNFDWANINSYATMPPNTNDINFEQIYQRYLYKLIDAYNCHVYNLACNENNKDATNKLYRYRFLHKIMHETHFDDKTKLLHIKQTDQWINNANPIAMVFCRCNHDLNSLYCPASVFLMSGRNLQLGPVSDISSKIYCHALALGVGFSHS
jgi:hypothetical protein